MNEERIIIWSTSLYSQYVFISGVSEVSTGKKDGFNPTTKDEFNEFADLLTKKINLYKSKEEFPAFVDDLVRNIVVQSKYSFKCYVRKLEKVFFFSQKRRESFLKIPIPKLN